MTQVQRNQVLKSLIQDVVEAIVKATARNGYGIPGGHLYAGLMGVLDLDSFNRLMSLVVATGKVRRSGDCYIAPAQEN